MDLQQNLNIASSLRTKSSTSKHPVTIGEDVELSDTSDDNAPKTTSRKNSFKCPDPYFGSFRDGKTSSSVVGKSKKTNMHRRKPSPAFSSDEDNDAAGQVQAGRNSTIISSFASRPTIASTSTSREFSFSSHSESLEERRLADGPALRAINSVDVNKVSAHTRPKIKKLNPENFGIVENDSDDDLFVPNTRRKLPPSFVNSSSNGAKLKAPQEEFKRSAKVIPLSRNGTKKDSSSPSRKPTSADADFFNFFDTMLDIPTAVNGENVSSSSQSSIGGGRQKEKRKVKRKAAEAGTSSRDSFFESLFSRDYGSTSSGDMDFLSSATNAVGKDRKTKTHSTKAPSNCLRHPSNDDDFFFTPALVQNETPSNAVATGGNSPTANGLNKKDGIAQKSSIGSSSDGSSMDNLDPASRHDDKAHEQTSQNVARRKSGSGEGSVSFNTMSSTGFRDPNGKASVPGLGKVRDKSCGRKYTLKEQVSDAETVGQSGSMCFGSPCSAFSRIGPDGGTSGDAARNTTRISFRNPEAFDFNLPRTVKPSRSEAAGAAAAAAAAGNSIEDSQANESNEEHPPPPPPSPRSRVSFGRRPMNMTFIGLGHLAAVDDAGSPARAESAKGQHTVSRVRFVRPRTATAVTNIDELLAPPERPIPRDRGTAFRSPSNSSRRMMLDSTEEEDVPALANGDGRIGSRHLSNVEPPAAGRISMSEVAGISPRVKLRKKCKDEKSGIGPGARKPTDVSRQKQPGNQWTDLNDIFDDESYSDADNHEQIAGSAVVENQSRSNTITAATAAASGDELAMHSNEPSSSDSAKKSKKQLCLRSTVRAPNGVQTSDSSNTRYVRSPPAATDRASTSRLFQAPEGTTSRPTRARRISLRRVVGNSAAMSRPYADSSRTLAFHSDRTRVQRRLHVLEEGDDSSDELWSLRGNPSTTNVGNAGHSPECIEITSSDSDSSSESDNDVMPIERHFFPQVNQNRIIPTRTFFRPHVRSSTNRSLEEGSVRSAFTNVSAGSRSSGGLFRLPGLTDPSTDMAAGSASGTEFDVYHCRLLLERIRNFSNYQWELHVALRDGLDAPTVPADYSGPPPDSLVDSEVLEYMVHCQQNGLEIPRPRVSAGHSGRTTSPTSHRRRIEAFRRMTSRAPATLASESTSSLNPLNTGFTEPDTPIAGNGLAPSTARLNRRPRHTMNRLPGRRPYTAGTGSGVTDAAVDDVTARAASAMAAARTRSDFAAATASAASAAAVAARTASAATAADVQTRSFGSIFFQPLLSYMMNGEMPPGNAPTAIDDINVNNVLDNIFGRMIDGNDRPSTTGRTSQRSRRGSARQQRVFLHFDIDGLDDYEHLVNLIEGIGEVSRGLDRSDIEKLPVKTFTKSELATDAPVPECNICISEYEDGEQLRILQCFHKFHAGCIDKWLQVNRSCPTCREQVQV